eukprot:11767660-Ditylum_brightwellii.AAC.1
MAHWHHLWCQMYHGHCHHEVVVIVTIHQPYPIRDTANTAPQTTQSNPLPPKQQQKHSNQLSCASIGTSRMPSSRCHYHHSDPAPC